MPDKYDEVMFYKDASEDTRWRMVAAENKQVIAVSSEGYRRKEDALANFYRVTGAIHMMPSEGRENTYVVVRGNNRPMDEQQQEYKIAVNYGDHITCPNCGLSVRVK